jgi:hypothetical protein
MRKAEFIFKGGNSMFYQDILNSFTPKYGILKTETIDIERTTGASFTSINLGKEEQTISKKPRKPWTESYIGLNCEIFPQSGKNFTKEFNIAYLVKKIHGWKYLTEKRIEKVKNDLRLMNGKKVEIENTNTGYRIKDLEEILKKPPKKRGRKPGSKNKVKEVKAVKKQKPAEKEQQIQQNQQVFSFEAFSDNSLKIAMAEYAELILNGNLPEEGILNKLITAYKVDNQQKSAMMTALLEEVANRWKI